MALKINVTLTPINHEGCAHEGIGDDGLCTAGIARLLGRSNG
jgi:hypothetical protein